MLDLDLHRYKDRLQVKKEGGKTYLRCALRKKYLVLQPEEIVRQLVVYYLVEELNYPKGRIQMERGLHVFENSRRFDLLVLDRELAPYLLIECKSHRVPLRQSTFDQASLYNTQVNAPYLLITNGVQTFCAAIDRAQGQYTFVDIPEYP